MVGDIALLIIKMGWQIRLYLLEKLHGMGQIIRWIKNRMIN